MAQDAVRRNLPSQLNGKTHFRCPGFFQGVAFRIRHFTYGEGEGPQIRADAFHGIPLAKLIAQAANGISVFVAAFYNGAHLPLADVAGIFRILTGETVVEAGGVDPV